MLVMWRATQASNSARSCSPVSTWESKSSDAAGASADCTSSRSPERAAARIPLAILSVLVTTQYLL
ncbi:MAG: hypothetical protein ABI693_20425 [Bryobacteraceae bacterium]